MKGNLDIGGETERDILSRIVPERVGNGK